MGQAHGANRMAIAAMANVIKYSKDELLALSKQFQAVARKDKPEDCMSRDLFHSCMELVGIHETDREILDKLFTLYDKTGDDVINYREFVCGISVLMRGSLGDKLEFAFHMFDWDDLGRLSKDEMSRALVSVNSTMSYFGDKHMSEKEIGAIVDGVRTGESCGW